MRMEKLKACPFCGSEVFIWEESCGWKVSCNKSCVTIPPTGWFTSEKVAIKAWNTRNPPCGTPVTVRVCKKE